MELHLITSKHLQIDHKQAWPTWNCIRVTAGAGVTKIPPVASPKQTGSNLVTRLDALLNVYTGGRQMHNIIPAYGL